jgi:single-strand DNA-binding protein
MLNKVILVGHAGLNAETRQLTNGTKVARISLATSKSVKQEDGSFKQYTTWHNVVGFAYSAEKLSKVQKGDKVLIEGEISSRSYENDGIKQYITDINANSVINLTPRAAAPLTPIADRYEGATATQEEFEQHMQDISPLAPGDDLPF